MFRSTPLLLQFDDHTGDPAGEETEQAPEFVLPENLTDLSDEEITDLEGQAVAAFDAIRAGDLDAEALQALSDLTAAIEALRGEVTAREEAREQAAAEAEALASRVHGAAETEDEEGEGETPAETAETAGEGETPAETPAPEAEETEEAPQAVAAASAPAAPRRPIRVPLSAVRRHSTEPTEVVNNDAAQSAIVAASEIPGVAAGGASMTMLQVAEGMHARARHLGEGGTAPVASFQRPARHVIEERADFDTMQEVITAAATLPGDGSAQGLVAAGGWCAPSETVYDLFSIEGQDGLVDVPTITVRRGGIEFVTNGGPSIADVFGSTGIWLWTEQNDIDAGTAGLPDPTKPCATIPCVGFSEERLDAHGICLTHGNLADRAYPELTRRYIDLVMSAHAHIVNYRRLTAMAAAATDVTIAAGAHGAASPLLDAIDLQGMDYRDKYRMDDGAVLEIVLPRWVRGLVRADLARRNGVDLMSVSNAQITQWFVERQYRPQFVYDWLSLQTGPSIAQSALAVDGFREAWPTEARALIYAAGTFVAGNGGSIDLAVTRDSTLNATNDHTAAFTEEFLLLAKRGHEARELIVTGLAANGATGAQTAP